VADRDLHQLVPRRVELDLVDSFAEAVVSAQPRRVRVGLEAPVDGLLRAGERAEVADQVVGPACALALEGFAQRCVRFEEVVVDERRRLVQDFADARSTS
jgi:hypothetical protein